MANKVWPVWKTVKIGISGLCERADFMREFVEKVSCHDGRFEKFITTMDICYAGEEEIKLALVSLAELGFSAETTKRVDFFAKLPLFGLGLVPAVVGFCLRAQYNDQPEEERFHMAMNPVVLPKTGSAGLFLFGKRITCDNADNTNSLSLDCQFACRIAN